METSAEFIVRIRREVESLAKEFEGIFSIETVQQRADEAAERFSAATVREFVPLMVYKYTREQLRAASQAEGFIMKDKPEVLFVCVHNAGRSQMAAALTSWRSGDRVHVRSAGSTPASEINPAVVEAMRELGIDISEEFPKPLADEFVRAADVVITMGCGDACPIYPGKKYLDWDVPDPAGQPLDIVRGIRDEIRSRVEGLISEMITPSPAD